ncbi:restriction endonuclease subunit S [Georgenia sp. 311]|uniref:restriction endonuclease subunit S n=1 Tax=Georgenia sp. 311 TaxID=2585134 RepID=UPI001112AD0F|nr:restriction endonuclease subunit S [Georgenia sp. 311]TNC18345.1 restriction endonuclease subunit S [Georgenia sp. 311]
MRTWEEVRLHNLLVDGVVSYGVVQPGSEAPGGVPIVRVKDLSGGRIDMSAPLRVSPEVASRHGRTRLEGGEVLLSIVGSIGETALVPPELEGWNVARAIAVLRPAGVSPRWLQLCLQSPTTRQQIGTLLNTTVQATLNLADLRELRIPLPPEPVRSAIAEVLGSLDEKIAANDRVCGSLHELMSAEFATLTLTASDRVPLGDVAKLEYGKSLPATRRRKGAVPVYGSGGIGGYHDEPLRPGPGVVVGRKGTVGSVYWSQRDYFAIDTTYFVSPVPGGPGLPYLYFALRSTGLDESNSDSAVPGLNRDAAYRVPVPIAEFGAREEFEERVLAAFTLRDAKEQESRSLSALRDTLLPALMSGRLSVKDAENTVSEVV